MNASIPIQQAITAGTVVAKGNFYHLVMTWYEPVESEDDKAKTRKRTKWLPTKISVDEPKGKTKAKDLLLLVRVAFDRSRPDVPISEMLSLSNSAGKGSPTADDSEGVAELEERDRGILFSDYMQQWLEDIRHKVETTTFGAYQVNIRRITQYFDAKGFYLNEITAADIHMFYKDMQKRGIKTETVIRYHSNIRKALVDALEFNEIYGIDANILVKLKKPVKPEKEEFNPSFYSVEEINEMFKVLRGNRIELVVKLTAFYGFRREEVLGLKWSAIDFSKKTLTVSHTVTQCCVDGKAVMEFKDRGKNRSSRRTMPLVADLSELLQAHKKAVEQNRKTLGKAYNKKYIEYICVDDSGDMIKPSYVTKNFRKALEDNLLRKIRFHDLRHSCASLLVACNVPMKIIQEWLGHSNFSTTADLYSHLEHSQKVESANALANIGLVMLTQE
jgi:integrase